MAWYISRQHCWPDGDFEVQISEGIDFAGPDQLLPLAKWKKLGDGQLFKDPREAVEAAIKVRDAWNEHKGLELGDEECVEIGGCFGDGDDDYLRNRGLAAWGQLVHCMYCGELIDPKDKRSFIKNPDDEDEYYCDGDCFQRGIDVISAEICMCNCTRGMHCADDGSCMSENCTCDYFDPKE